MKTFKEQRSTTTGNKLTHSLHSRRRKQGAINVTLIRPPPVDRRIRGPTVRRFKPVQVIAECNLHRQASTITSIPLQGIRRGVLRQVVRQRAVKVRVTTSVPIPRKSAFNLYVRNSTIRHALIRQLGTRTRKVPLTRLHLSNLRIGTGFVASFRGLNGRSQRLLLATRDTFTSRVLAPTMRVPRRLARRFRQFTCGVARAHPTSRHFLQGTQPRAIRHRLQGGNVPTVKKLFVNQVKLVRVGMDLPRNHLRRRKRHVYHFVAPRNAFREALTKSDEFNVRNRFVKRPREL